MWRQNLPKEEGAYLLVFDHNPNGYRKACDWIRSSKWDGTSPIYRLLIPCARFGQADDIDDFEYVFREGPRPEFVGFVDRWPEDTVFRTQRVIVDEIPEHPNSLRWPGIDRKDGCAPGTITLSRMYKCGHCSERMLVYPNLFTGLTHMQQYMLDRAALTHNAKDHAITTLELVQHTAAHFRVEFTTVMDQFERLTFGNAPWVISRPTRASFVELNDSFGEDPDLPPWLLNGPFPLGESYVKGKFIEMLNGKKMQVTWNDAQPFCPKHVFIPYLEDEWRSVPVPVGEDGEQCRIPYGVTSSQFSKMNPEIGMRSDTTAHASRSEIKYADCKLGLTFCRGRHELVTFPSLDSYARDWYERKLSRMVQTKDMAAFISAREAQEATFISTLYLRCKTTKMVGKNKVEVLTFTDESMRDKKRYLLDTFGRDNFTYLWNLPIWKLGPQVFYADGEEEEEEGSKKIVKDPKVAREVWLEALQGRSG